MKTPPGAKITEKGIIVQPRKKVTLQDITDLITTKGLPDAVELKKRVQKGEKALRIALPHASKFSLQSPDLALHTVIIFQQSFDNEPDAFVRLRPHFEETIIVLLINFYADTHIFSYYVLKR